MSNVVLHVAQSIDGYISRKDGTVDYLGGFNEDMMTHFRTFIARIDVVVMGRTTYEEYKKYDIVRSRNIVPT